MRGDVQATIADVRRIVDGLRPAALDELGLVGSLRRLVDGAPTGGPQVRLVADGRRLPRRRRRGGRLPDRAGGADQRRCGTPAPPSARCRCTADDGHLVVRVDRRRPRARGGRPARPGRGWRRCASAPRSSAARWSCSTRPAAAPSSAPSCRGTRRDRAARARRRRPPAVPRRGHAACSTRSRTPRWSASAGDGEAAVREATLHPARRGPDGPRTCRGSPVSRRSAGSRRPARSPPSSCCPCSTTTTRCCAAMRAGARGYVLKGAGQEELLAAIRAVAAGGRGVRRRRRRPDAGHPRPPRPGRRRVPRAHRPRGARCCR